MIPYRIEVASAVQTKEKQVCKDFIINFLSLGSPFKETKGKRELRKSFWVLKFTMNLLGILPVTVMTDGSNRYAFQWSKVAPIHCLVNISWLTCLLICSCVGIVLYFPSTLSNLAGSRYPEEGSFISYENLLASNSSLQFSDGAIFHGEEFLGILVVLGSILNAWVQSLTIFYRRREIAKFLNNWSKKVICNGINPLSGMFKLSTVSCLLLYVFALLLLAACLVGKPIVLVGVIDAFSKLILIAPPNSDLKGDLTPKEQAVRLVTCIALLHAFMIHKVTILAFASNCKLLANSFRSWRHHLHSILNGYWEVTEMRTPLPPNTKSLQEMVKIHRNIVFMLRKVENLFHPILQFYYASSVVSMCTMLYFIAFQLGPNRPLTLQECIWQGIVLGQSSLVFLMVSLSASGVHDESEKCFDVLRVGLPHDAPQAQIYYFHEVYRHVTMSPIAISGNRFFIITKPFILTIIGAIISYFIIVLQLHHST